MKGDKNICVQYSKSCYSSNKGSDFTPTPSPDDKSWTHRKFSQDFAVAWKQQENIADNDALCRTGELGNQHLLSNQQATLHVSSSGEAPSSSTCTPAPPSSEISNRTLSGPWELTANKEASVSVHDCDSTLLGQRGNDGLDKPGSFKKKTHKKNR